MYKPRICNILYNPSANSKKPHNIKPHEYLYNESKTFM